jgi:hypothetical protein
MAQPDLLDKGYSLSMLHIFCGGVAVLALLSVRHAPARHLLTTPPPLLIQSGEKFFLRIADLPLPFMP